MKIIGANVTGSFILNSQDVTTTIQTSNVWSGSVATDITALNAATASLLNYTASNNATISDILLETASINTFTSSISSRTSVIEGKYITTGSNTFVGTQYVSNTTQATTFTSTASLYTDGGLRIGKDAYVSGSAFIKGNLTVFGTSSIEYVTSSVFVGLEYIDLNTDLPALRYAGIRVYDSGSNVGVTGSLFWDSQTNHWVYANPSGSSYSGGMMISGPRASSLGSEEGTTNNALMKGQGGDHITSSAILDNGTSLRIPYLTIVNGTVGATTFSGSGANLTSIPNAALTNSTISGISLGSNLATLTIGTGLSGTSYNGSGAVTIANTGVTSIVAGTNISISGGTGAVTITNGVTNNNQLTNGAGYITSAGTAAAAGLVNATSGGAIQTWDIRTIAPSSMTTGRLGFGFTSWANNNSAPYADFLHLRSYSDGSGGADNLVMFLKSGIGMRIYQQSFGSGTAYSSYVDVLHSSNFSSYALPLSGGTLSGGLSGTTATFTGNITVSSGNATGGGIILADDGDIVDLNDAYCSMRFSSGVRIFSANRGGSAVHTLHANGTFTASGDVVAYSDKRVKENIITIDNALSKVLSLRGVYYNRTDKDNKSQKIGVIAQEIQEVLPQVVFEQPEDGMLGVSYGNITAVLIEAIKEQQTQIEELKTIINALTK
jgi:hypothetical protein